MYSFPYATAITALISACLPLSLNAENQKTTEIQDIQPFQAFTGRVKGNRVRIRLQPNLDSVVLRQTPRGELFVVVGETDDFYAIAPPKEVKGYVYRTFVLDNIIEGNRVNIRLEPNVESPIIAQLNQGDRIEGQLYEANPKWMEISPPASTRFYINKDYIEPVGNANYLAQLEQRQSLVNQLLQDALVQVEMELKTSIELSQFDTIKQNLNRIIAQFPDFPEQQTRAKEALAQLQEDHLHKKTRDLEQQAKLQHEVLENRSQQIEAYLSQKQQQIEENQRQLESQNQMPPASTPINIGIAITPKMLLWNATEERLFQAWKKDHPGSSLNDFYDQQRKHAVWLKGTIEPYARLVKNKPGDYVLLNAQRLPIAYLYSNLINLEDWVGHQVTIEASERPNNQFAFKAFYVLSVE